MIYSVAIIGSLPPESLKKRGLTMVLSILSWTAPLWAATGIFGAVALWAGCLARGLAGYTLSYALLSRTGLPTFISSLAWRTLAKPRFSSWPVLYWPLIACSLFALRVGVSADLLYAGYWLLIPALFVAVPATARTTNLFRAIVCSLTAHSVGSLIILYAGFSFSWFALMPVVLFERLVTALGMTGMAYAYQSVSALVSRKGPYLS